MMNNMHNHAKHLRSPQPIKSYDPSNHRWWDQRSPRRFDPKDVPNGKYLEIVRLVVKHEHLHKLLIWISNLTEDHKKV